jgi:hypothetical protein
LRQQISVTSPNLYLRRKEKDQNGRPKRSSQKEKVRGRRKSKAGKRKQNRPKGAHGEKRISRD